ncbi:OsmC family peroxiredoxin [Catelliglobosispora koreensis]|uniref:OsmC family peroxiredoxin n=1 Tax=Catelliglobosispora koreensis TaxID=129052 RepID=UPI0003803BCF|nr:OsmC family peroxiredoxin [Catelliglobosispora koreensis]
MPIRKASARWQGTLKEGSGTIHTGLGAGNYSFSSRFEEGEGTNPEEMIGAAIASCFSMFFANKLDGAGFTATSVETTANVHLEKTDAGMTVTKIDLISDVVAPGIDKDEFEKLAQESKAGCPISRLLSPGAEITVAATLA